MHWPWIAHSVAVSIVLHNLDPFEWKHVSIHCDRIDEVARELVTTSSLQPADWTEILPPDLNLQEQVDYIIGLISIDFCHWGEDHKDFYATDDSGRTVRGSAAMSALAKKAYRQGVHLFDAAFMQTTTAGQLRPYFTGFDVQGQAMTIPWLEARAEVLNEIGHILLDKWSGSFYHLYLAAQGRAFNQGGGFVELLARDFPRFKDEYVYNNKCIKIYKLAQLAVIALQSASGSAFQDGDDLTVCADYQLPRSLRALGILQYGPELANRVDQELLIPAGSALEIELRMATVFAADLLKKAVNALLEEKKVSSQDIDYLLWSHGRTLDRNTHQHHFTKTIMY